MGARAPDRVLLGSISRPHGVRGEVLVRSFCEPPEEIAAFGPLADADGARSFTLTLRGATTKGLIARIDGVDDRDAAEGLRGTELYIDRDRLPEPEDDEIYQVDVVGLEARDRDGIVLGTVVAIQNFGAGDLLEIQLPDRDRTEFYPFGPRFIADLDLDHGHLVIAIDPPEDASDEEQPP